MMPTRVAVTGLGAVTPCGIGMARTWEGLVAGRSGIATLTHLDASAYSTRFGGYAHDFVATNWLDAKEARRMSRFIQMAVVAADEAVAQAGLDIHNDPDADRIGVIVGSGIGGLLLMEEQHTVLKERGPDRMSPFLIAMMIIDEAAGNISIRLGARGINYAPVSACATGSHAVGEAAEAIRRGQAVAVIAGGFDAGITPLGLGGFCAARALSTRNDDPAGASRPFDLARDGFVMAEGGAVLVLEEWERARARGATILAEVVGYGATADAYHITAPAPSGDGARRAMEEAVSRSGLPKSAVGYINAHGTSTQPGDAAESEAIRNVFGEDVPFVSSTKSMTGHMLGGAGALEAAVCVMALDTGILPPTINLTDPDPACDLPHVANVAREARIEAAMSNSFGFGGHNAALVVAAPER